MSPSATRVVLCPPAMRFAFVCMSLLVTGCALRPRYEELAKRFVPQEGRPTEVQVHVLDGNDAPVPGARIEIGDRYRFKAVTDEQGIFRMPVDKKYSDENG